MHFGPNPTAAFNVVDDNVIVATTPSGTGVVHVTVTTALGTSAATTANQYTNLANLAPTVSSISPNTGASRRH